MGLGSESQKNIHFFIMNIRFLGEKGSRPKLLVCHLYALKCMSVQVHKHSNVISVLEKNGPDNIHV